jgi:hypothetical protein
VGSCQFAKSFFADSIANVKDQVNQLFVSLSDKSTILRLFSTCAMHKTPHLLGSEVLYTANTSADNTSWNNWQGPLATNLHQMVQSFFARLTNSSTIPESSMLIAYMSIAHRGLSLMDPHTRAIPDSTITMASVVRAATSGFYIGRDT